MRKESLEIAKAFKNRQAKKMARTETNGESILLHGNLIAKYTNDGILLTLAGWPTTTTRERLNTVLCVFGINGRFSQSKGKQYFNGEEITEFQKIIVKAV